jgi:hypothetical protein
MFRILALCLVVSGCSTTAPSTINFPTPPELLMRKPLALKPLPKLFLKTTKPVTSTPKPYPVYKGGSESSQPLDD